ncbi:hypothetical protein [Haloplanus natans]|uniref:hypothetical protein n=1 Tax=Haloplanus natans TaxID=376171 RepID=UPI000677E49F|nr:hypothetical protein [Haloplanus natans]
MKLPSLKQSAAATGIAGLVLLLFLIGPSVLSVAQDSRKQSISFYHLTDDAGSTQALHQNLKDTYPGTFSDVAKLGKYRFDLSMRGLTSGGDGCFLVPKVKKNGVEIDQFNLQDNKITSYSGWADKDGTGRVEKTYGDYKASFGNTLYMDESVYYGTYYGVQSCEGAFNKYEMEIPWNKISVETNTPKKSQADNPVALTYTFHNQWKPMEADLEAEVCIGNGLCKTVRKENVSVPVGTSASTISLTPNATGELKTDFGGSIALDMEHLRVEGLSVDCDNDGSNERPSKCSSIEIGEIQGSDVVKLREKQLGLAQQIQLRLAKLYTGIIDGFPFVGA